MKFTRIVAAGAGVSLVAASTLLGATAANAVDAYVDLPTIPAETSPYSPTWFAGTVTGGTGTAVQDETGLVITGGAEGYQLLNGTPASTAPGGLATALSFPQVSSVGDAFYQISVFGEPDAIGPAVEFTTLRPLAADSLFGDWEVSQSVAGLTAGEAYSAEELIAALDAGAPAQVLAFGVFVNAGETVTLRGISNSTDRFFFYTADPTVTVAPSSLTVSQVSTTPVVVSASGFAPGEIVVFAAQGEEGGGVVGEAVANADGVASLTTEPFPDATPTTFEYVAYDLGGLFFSAPAEFSIVADPAVVDPAAPTLPPTGAETDTALIGAGVLFLIGAGLVVITMRRRASIEG